MRHSIPRPGRTLVGWGLLVAATLLAAGCGGGRQRFPVSGTVTYRGQPVAIGSIRFEAEASVGDFAPTCHAAITDGKFATKPDDSPAAGRYRVMVMGIDVPRIKKDGPPGTPWDMPALFPPYMTTVEIPPPNGTLNIDVPDGRDKPGK